MNLLNEQNFYLETRTVRLVHYLTTKKISKLRIMKLAIPLLAVVGCVTAQSIPGNPKPCNFPAQFESE